MIEHLTKYMNVYLKGTFMTLWKGTYQGLPDPSDMVTMLQSEHIDATDAFYLYILAFVLGKHVVVLQRAPHPVWTTTTQHLYGEADITFVLQHDGKLVQCVKKDSHFNANCPTAEEPEPPLRGSRKKRLKQLAELPRQMEIEAAAQSEMPPDLEEADTLVEGPASVAGEVTQCPLCPVPPFDTAASLKAHVYDVHGERQPRDLGKL